MTALLVLTTACQQAERRSEPAETSAGDSSAGAAVTPTAVAPTTARQAPFDAIAADETIRLVGNEPFWGGTVRAGELVYTTPENQAGETVAVRRFAGNNGLGFSGSLRGAPLDLTVTPGKCSDGMSDRSYPFTATLKLGDEQRNGCAWTDRMRFTGSESP